MENKKLKEDEIHSASNVSVLKVSSAKPKIYPLTSTASKRSLVAHSLY